METFYIVVLSIAIGFLILILTFFGILINSQNSAVAFPPVTNQCPDKWTVDTSYCILGLSGSVNVGNIYSNGVDCTSTVGLCAGNVSGSVKTPNTVFTRGTYGWVHSNPANKRYVAGDMSINFTDPSWAAQGLTSICKQKAWANQHHINWSGVSNYTQC